MPDFLDVEIHSTDEMNIALGKFAHPPGQWAVVYADGAMSYHATENEACTVQRAWRHKHGRNPMTGD